jgi:large subunit ribosomal protein L24
MKLQRKDKVMVISGRDNGKTGEIVAVLPKTNQVVIEGINVVKRHTKPTQSNPKGGILEITKPVNASKVMAIDPASGRPARVGYKLDKNGKKQRIFKVSKFKNAAAKKTTTKTTKPAKKEAKK